MAAVTRECRALPPRCSRTHGRRVSVRTALKPPSRKAWGTTAPGGLPQEETSPKTTQSPLSEQRCLKEISQCEQVALPWRMLSGCR